MSGSKYKIKSHRISADKTNIEEDGVVNFTGKVELEGEGYAELYIHCYVDDEVKGNIYKEVFGSGTEEYKFQLYFDKPGDYKVYCIAEVITPTPPRGGPRRVR